MLIPQVAEVPGGRELVRFFWCWSCMELTAFVGDPGRLAVRFAEDGRGGWLVFRTVGSEGEVQAALTAVSHVKPERGRWER
jgi:hypothetical protein